MPLAASASQAVMWAKRDWKKLAAKDWLLGVELAIVEAMNLQGERGVDALSSAIAGGLVLPTVVGRGEEVD